MELSMKPFTAHSGIVAPLDRANVDTDLIIPKQFLKSIKRTGFGPYLFDQLRYTDEGEPGMDCHQREIREEFVLNRTPYTKATILLTRENFGCGSSREHAPWALLDFGFRVIIAPSFADIFYSNCFKNGILPIVLQDHEVMELFQHVVSSPGLVLDVNLTDTRIESPTGDVYTFTIEPYRKHCLLEGLDDIDITLKNSEKIRAYERNRSSQCPWLFSDLPPDEL